METETLYSHDEILRHPAAVKEDTTVLTSNPQVFGKYFFRGGNRKEHHEFGNLEQEIRFRCLQGWFFRCSWSRKFEFIREICGLTTGVFVLEQVLKCIDPIYSKDVVDSFARDRINFNYDVIPVDDNRALSMKELNIAKQEDILWFLNLDSSSQIEVIVSLMKLGGGGLIFNIHREIDRLYKERKEMNMVLTAVDYSIREIETEASKPKYEENVKKSCVKSQHVPDEYKNQKLEQILYRNAELTEFKKKYSIVDVRNGKTGNGKKKEPFEIVDYIQVLPLWLSRKIVLYLDEKDLNELKKTGKYWARMIEDALRESAGRSMIDAKISKISDDKAEKTKDKRWEDTPADYLDVSVLGQDALLQELHLKQRDVVLMRKENESLTDKIVKVDVWEETCYAKLCCCVNEVCKLLAASTPKKTIDFYSLRTGTRIKNSVTGLPAAITAMDIHNEGFHIIVGCENGALINMNFRKNEKTISYKGHSGAVIQIHVAEDKIVSASDDKTIKHFDLWSGLCLFCVNIDGSITSMLTLEQDLEPQRVIAGTGEGKIFFIDLRKRKIYGEANVHDKQVTDMVEDRNILITGSSDKTIRLWSLKNLENIKKLVQVKPFIIVRLESTVTAINCLGNRIFAACADSKLRLICKLSGTTVRTIKVTQKKPITGIYVMQENDTMKMIIWHESGIEMRTIRFGKSLNAKKKERTNGGDEKITENHLHNRRLFSVLPTSLLHIVVPKPYSVKRFKTNDSDDMVKVAVDRSCTAGKLREESPGECETFSHDVFTAMLRKYKMLHPGDFDLRTFPRVRDKQCGSDSSSSDTDS